MMSIRLSDEMERRLSDLAARTGRTKAYEARLEKRRPPLSGEQRSPHHLRDPGQAPGGSRGSRGAPEKPFTSELQEFAAIANGGRQAVDEVGDSS
jgi:hypothetical protein